MQVNENCEISVGLFVLKVNFITTWLFHSISLCSQQISEHTNVDIRNDDAFLP